MPESSSTDRRPRSDDRRIAELIAGYLAFPTVVVAYDLGLFRILGQRPRSFEALCGELGVDPRPGQALLSVCAGLGFVEREGATFKLTPLAEDYLLDDAPTSVKGFFEFISANPHLASFESIKKATLANSPQMYGGEDWVRSHREQADLARVFTRSMHSHSVAPAQAWPERIDLSSHEIMLDVGGGSGAHAIGAARRWPDLKALIFELGPVCEVADEMVQREGLEERISTHEGDMWKDPFPLSDVHFYSQIFHDHPPVKCRLLAEKSFNGLPAGGLIVLHEMLLNDDKTGPLAVAATNVAMLVTAAGQQFTANELSQMLAEAGFQEIMVKPTFGYWSVVTGTKP